MALLQYELPLADSFPTAFSFRIALTNNSTPTHKQLT